MDFCSNRKCCHGRTSVKCFYSNTFHLISDKYFRNSRTIIESSLANGRCCNIGGIVTDSNFLKSGTIFKSTATPITVNCNNICGDRNFRQADTTSKSCTTNRSQSISEAHGFHANTTIECFTLYRSNAVGNNDGSQSFATIECRRSNIANRYAIDMSRDDNFCCRSDKSRDRNGIIFLGICKFGCRGRSGQIIINSRNRKRCGKCLEFYGHMI